jgi:hypothetical protein
LYVASVSKTDRKTKISTETRLAESVTAESGEVRIVKFLAVLAGLLGVVYSLFPVTPSILGNFPMRDLFAAYLLFFMIYSAVAYVSLTMGRPGARYLAYDSLALFSILLAFEFTLALFQIVSDGALFFFSRNVLVFFVVVLGSSSPCTTCLQESSD